MEEHEKSKVIFESQRETLRAKADQADRAIDNLSKVNCHLKEEHQQQLERSRDYSENLKAKFDEVEDSLKSTTAQLQLAEVQLQESIKDKDASGLQVESLQAAVTAERQAKENILKELQREQQELNASRQMLQTVEERLEVVEIERSERGVQLESFESKNEAQRVLIEELQEKHTSVVEQQSTAVERWKRGVDEMVRSVRIGSAICEAG